MQVPEPGNPVRGRNIHQEFILHVLEDVECGKAVALIVGKGVLGVNVPVDRLHAFLFQHFQINAALVRSCGRRIHVHAVPFI